MFAVASKGQGVQSSLSFFLSVWGKNCKIPPEWHFFKQVGNTVIGGDVTQPLVAAQSQHSHLGRTVGESDEAEHRHSQAVRTREEIPLSVACRAVRAETHPQRNAACVLMAAEGSSWPHVANCTLGRAKRSSGSDVLSWNAVSQQSNGNMIHHGSKTDEETALLSQRRQRDQWAHLKNLFLIKAYKLEIEGNCANLIKALYEHP